MTEEFSLYHFAGAPGFENDVRARFVPDEDGVATVGDAVLTFGKIDGRSSGVLVESAGETALVVQEQRIDPIQPRWED